MRIIFVYSLKCARTTLNKLLNSSGLNRVTVHCLTLNKLSINTILSPYCYTSLTVHFNVSNFKYHGNLNRLILCVLFVRKLNIVLVVMKTSILMLTFQAIWHQTILIAFIIPIFNRVLSKYFHETGQRQMDVSRACFHGITRPTFLKLCLFPRCLFL